MKEEDTWRQKPRELWLREGDKNMNIFHSKTITRRKSNRITKIKNEDGRWIDDRGEIGETM